jgi:hypothetical protein
VTTASQNMVVALGHLNGAAIRLKVLGASAPTN